MIPTREYVLEELFEVRIQLRSFGVQRIGVFGSVSRNTASESSDIDIIVGFASADETVVNFFGLQDFLSGHFQRKVDVITESGLKPFSRDLVMRDAVFVENLHDVEPNSEAGIALPQAKLVSSR